MREARKGLKTAIHLLLLLVGKLLRKMDAGDLDHEKGMEYMKLAANLDYPAAKEFMEEEKKRVEKMKRFRTDEPGAPSPTPAPAPAPAPLPATCLGVHPIWTLRAKRLRFKNQALATEIYGDEEAERILDLKYVEKSKPFHYRPVKAGTPPFCNEVYQYLSSKNHDILEKIHIELLEEKKELLKRKEKERMEEEKKRM